MSIKINDLQLNMKNVIDFFVKITSFLMTTQMGTQISSLKDVMLITIHCLCIHYHKL